MTARRIFDYLAQKPSVRMNKSLVNQGLQFRPVPPDIGGTYRSIRLPVCGPPTTRRFRQKSTVGGRLRKKKGRRRGKKEKKKRIRKNISPPHRRRLRVARGSFFSRARRWSVSPRGEKDRGDVTTMFHLDRPMYLLGYLASQSRVYLIDKEFNVAHFLESRGMLEDALEVATDPNYRFDLAVQLGRLEIAKVNPKASESLADPEEYPNLFEDWQVALAVESNLAHDRFLSCHLL
ncbi:hypothetical protein BHM03_00011270 [Ensete ventricosum]|nr:hypothetical protein BHM03_00011270 [Ensete ventricosum]